jgi:hypothetical protein
MLIGLNPFAWRIAGHDVECARWPVKRAAQPVHRCTGKRVTNSAKQGELRLFKAVFDAKKRVFVHGIVRVSLYKMRKVLALISW